MDIMRLCIENDKFVLYIGERREELTDIDRERIIKKYKLEEAKNPDTGELDIFPMAYDYDSYVFDMLDVFWRLMPAMVKVLSENWLGDPIALAILKDEVEKKIAP